MILKDLNVLHNDNSSFVDVSSSAQDYLRDTFQIQFTAAEDELLLGLYKPFNSAYFEFTALTSPTALTLEISTAASFVSLEANDDTNGLSRSGFIDWEREQDSWKSQTIDGKDLYWLKITTTGDWDITFNGINLVYADDNDMRSEFRNIDELIAPNDTTFIAYHVAARNEIVQTLRNGGNVKQLSNDSAGTRLNMNKWDVLDRGEIRQAAKYLALAKIMFDVSENTEDKMYQRYRDYEGMWGSAFKLFYMSLDNDDDGVADDFESLALNDITISKI